MSVCNDFLIPDTLTCLNMAAGGEHDEWTEMYPRMAKAVSYTHLSETPRMTGLFISSQAVRTALVHSRLLMLN